MNTKLLHFSAKTYFVLAVFLTSFALQAQTTVFSDDFEIQSGLYYTVVPGAIPNSSWTMSRSGTDFGAGVKQQMKLINDGTNAANANGWVLASTNASAFSSPYNTTLNANAGLLSWTFNMRQIQSNPSGFNAAEYGMAFILAGTSGTTNLGGTGYAVVLGGAATADPVRLVRYNAGIRNHTTLISSNTSGLTDFGAQYLSVKVTYAPSTNTWQLFVRNDNASFADPASGSLTLQGTVANSTYTSTVLPMMGCYWNASTLASQTAFFDNVKVTVAVPTLTSIAPSSKVAGSSAFTLTVNGTNFVNGVSTVKWYGVARTTTYVSSTQLTAAITAANIASPGDIPVTVANGSATSNAINFDVDPAGVPVLTVSTNVLPDFSTIAGSASATQSYTISGAFLTAAPIITAPANFEISTNGTTFFNSLTLGLSGSAIAGQPLTIYTRVKASVPAGLYSGSITHTTTGAITKNVAVAATVLAVQPTTQPIGISFTNVTSTSFTINWTNGNGSQRIALIRAGSAVNTAPTDGSTYPASPVFGSGSEIGTGNFVVYAGTGNSVVVTGLTATSAYYVALYEFNGSSATENYLTTTPGIANRTTLNAPVGWQIGTANTINTINFDTTVDGVNADTFQGNGFSATAISGELNSNAWSVAGFSDGAVAFGATSADDSDFSRGTSVGDETLGGIYAYETSADNFALGIQPAAGDFAPGSVTLRFQNQTGAAITSINVGYKIYVLNDEAASNNLNFSHSANNTSYTAVAGLDATSVATADLEPAWKAYYRVVTLTGLNIANNNYYYFKWTGNNVSGSGVFDGFALDDITMIANPSTNFVPFSGTATSLAVMGNTTLSDNLTVETDLAFNGGKLDLNGKTLTLNGSVANTTLQGLKGSATSNVTIASASNVSLSFDQTTPSSTNLVNNLTIATTGANTTTVLNPIAINGALTTAVGQTVDFGTNALTGTLSTINNNGIIKTQNTTATPLPVGKIWNGTGTIHYNAASAQQTVVVGTYNGLAVSTTGGAIAAGALTVNGILNLPTSNPSATVGSLSMGSYVLTMGGSSTNTGIGDVIGIVTRNLIIPNTLYTFGHAHTSIVFPNTGTLPTSMSLKIAIGVTPAWRPGAIKRTYDFIETGGVATKATIRSHYLDSELNGNNESKLVDWARIVSSSTTFEQGRSNYDTTDNYTELTNVNVGLYFTNTFNQVLLTLDESEAGMLTWNGSLSSSWTTAVNWTPNATPSDATSVFIPDAATTPNDPTLNPAVLLGSLNIEAGGIVNAPDDSQFTINGAGGAWINDGTFNPGGGTSRVIFTNLDATIAGATNFNNVTINTGGGIRPLSNNYMRIAGSLVNNGSLLAGVMDNTIEFSGINQTIPNPTGTVQAYHNLIISGTGALFPTTLNVTGDLTLNQPVDFTAKTIVMKGNHLQLINGTANPIFNNLTVNNSSSGVAMGRNTTIGGTLTLTAGKLDVGNNTLMLGANPVVGTFSASTMIVASGTGEVRRTFTSTGSYTYPIGDTTGTADYSPITVFVNSGGFSNASIGVSVVDAIHPDNASASRNLTRYWKVNQSGITGAIASISANYTAVDLTGPESEVAAAQLNGTFNQQINPWIKYATLTANTLSAPFATLTAGQTSVFTGIKGADFSVVVTGYGSFCQNQIAELTAAVNGGSPPYTYLWSGGLGTQATATAPTSTIGTVNYTVTVKDSNGLTVTDNNNVEVLAPSEGGTLAPAQEICAGQQPADITLTGNVGTILHWESSPDLTFANPTIVSNITNILTGASIGTVNATVYYRALVANGSCAEVFSAPIGIVIRSTTWNGASWSAGIPTSTTTAIISGDYTATSNLEACSLTVTDNATVIIPSGFDVTLNGSLNTAFGNFTLENNANLIQLTDAVNVGTVVVKRNSSALKRLDYTLWASPVDGQNLFNFSPLTVSTRFYTYNSDTNLYNAVASPSAVNFDLAKGYLIRTPNNHPSVTPTIWQGKFTGIPNNGTINFELSSGAVGQRFNAVGNPYPSPISAADFVDDNSQTITGTLYFWRKTNNELSPSYCSWTKNGGFVNNGEAQVFNLNGIIRTGQGFFVEGSGVQTTLSFKNSQRSSDNADQFFRASNDSVEKNRIWLNATSSTGAYSQMLVGYITNATLGVDYSIDGKYINDGPIALTSMIDSVDYTIQGRPLPFDNLDVVPLRFKTTEAGSYTIAIDHVDGFFSGTQDIFLKDNLLGNYHDLKASSYTFASDPGNFDARFEIVYQPLLGLDNPNFVDNNVVVYKQNDKIAVDSGRITMDLVQVYDIRGRLLLEQKAVNATRTTFDVAQTNQVLLIKITSDTGQTVTKKMVY